MYQIRYLICILNDANVKCINLLYKFIINVSGKMYLKCEDNKCIQKINKCADNTIYQMCQYQMYVINVSNLIFL